MTGQIVGSIDVAQVVLYAFWIFFAGLIWYIRKEDRREGYPLEDDVTGNYNKDPWLFVATPKTFKLPHGGGEVSVPDLKRDERKISAERSAQFPGAPLQPIGDPLLAGVGPGSWAEGSNKPDLTAHGEPRIVPMRSDKAFDISQGETDPRGMSVMGCDGEIAGEVSDVWVDRSEFLIRYYEVKIGDGKDAISVLLPNNFVVFKNIRGGKVLYVHAIKSGQFSNVPKTAKRTQVTLLEEDKIAAYYGAGLLYADERRAESVL